MAGNLDYLRQFLSIERLEKGSWQAFERDVARLLQHGGFNDVEVIGGSGDGGADVVAVKGKKKWVVQVKYSEKFEVTMGKDSVHQAFVAREKYKADVCAVATNKYFSSDAKEYLEIQKNLGFKAYLWDKDKILELCASLDAKSKNFRDPRKYQTKAIEKIYSEIKQGGRKGLLTLATGLGKTIISTSIINKFLEDNPNANILVLAHIRELVRQLEKASWTQFSKNISTHIFTDREKPSSYEGVVFATWQSVSIALQNGEFAPQQFDLIVVDECHRAPSKEYSNLIKKMDPSFLLGVTATPWREDKNSLEELFGKPLFSMNVVEGMRKGFLAEVDYKMLTDDINWEKVYNLSTNGYTIKDLNQRLYVPERDISMVQEIVKTIQETTNPRVLVFCRSIAHAKKLLGLFKSFDISSSIIHGKLSRIDRFEALSSFRVGSISVLTSIEMLNEGIDVPDVNIVCFARVTHSRRIFLQQLGRGLRISQNKTKVKVLDFVADIRRIAEGMEMNNEASKVREEESVFYSNGEIIKFSSDASSFFDQYLADMGDISNLDDNATLEFPPIFKY